MSPGAYLYDVPPRRRDDHRSVVWASLIAIVFVAIAAASFAIDQTLTVSSPPPKPHVFVR